jgi:endonuclease/exonuclease/phosphatase family metal-dependent hydrolase
MTNSRDSLRVMAYNLYFGGGGRVAAIHAVLAQADAHIVALTEADDPRVVAELAGRLGMQQIWARGSGDRHIALLSRFPIASWRVYNRRPITQAVLEARVDVARGQTQDLTPTTTFGVRLKTQPQPAHPPAGSLANPQSPIPNLQLPISTFTVYAVHLLPYLLLPFEVRRMQALRALLQIIRRDAPGPHLILGDLNAIAPGDRVLQRNNPPRMRRLMALQGNLIFRLAIRVLLRAGYTDCYRACHPRGGPAEDLDGFTWHTGNRTTRYDYIFADRSLAPGLRACRVLDEGPAVEAASDHYPVIADFDLSSYNPASLER